MKINVTEMLTVWSESSPSLARLVDGVPRDEQIARGYGRTVAEICRQPETWRTTAAALHDETGRYGLAQAPVVLTGPAVTVMRTKMVGRVRNFMLNVL